MQRSQLKAGQWKQIPFQNTGGVRKARRVGITLVK